MRMEREVLTEEVKIANSYILRRESIDKAILEFFMESQQRVGFPGRMPKVQISKSNGYYRVEIYSHSFQDADKLWGLIRKYDNQAELPAYITN